MNEGWIKLHRKLTDCILWTSDEPFDKRSAWIDLLLMANHKDKSIIFNGKTIVIKRGQYLTSIRKLSEHWHWSVNKTSRFLSLLESLKMIRKESDNYRTLLTLENYGVYQGLWDTDEYTDEYTDESQTRMIKNVKNEKNIYVKNDVQEIVDSFNQICVSFPKVVKMSDKRKKLVKSILKEYTVEELVNAFHKAEASDFMKSGSWAGFDWLMNKNNLLKVIEGNYDNKSKKVTKNEFNSFEGKQDYDFDAIEKMMLSK